ncbi:methyltransferase [Kitasatospora camelliae]|uniref:Methyltransferase n=1 Tax=Kitasatospora camelliae TaxID=3156397 RepID=A0AAU8K5T4_9ACTN
MSTVHAPTAAPTDRCDLDRIEDAVAFIRTHDTAGVLAALLPGLDPAERAGLAAHSAFTHAAVLVFPESVAGLREELRAGGLDVGPVTPSVVVRDRLARRYGRPADTLDVGILRAPVTAADGRPCEVEIFALAVPAGAGQDAVVAAERARQHEAHLALEVTRPDAVVLAGLRETLLTRGRMTADGGGHNAHEGSTVLYFRCPEDTGTPYTRLELNARGAHPGVLGRHLGEGTPAQSAGRGGHDGADGHRGPAERLLHLMTGAWATQALAVAADLRLADHLAAEPRPDLARLADLTGTHRESLGRLLRYLATLGVVTTADPADGYLLTPIGELLRTDAESSLHPLALMYGGPFYRSFGELGHSVRTGREGFDHLFGAHHFEYFAERPELADLFDRSMAASSAMFGPIPGLVDLSAVRTVVDVAGGNGELLSRILRAAPHLEGVLLERPHAVEAARATMAKAGCADRCRLEAGDFTRAVPAGGDLYLLSRVLHDWDDEQCLAILRRIAAAMPEHAELLVVERLLPQDGQDSLAVPWDVHMLCNVGGRERTSAHYADLLATAGLRLTSHTELPLDAALLRVRKA